MTETRGDWQKTTLRRPNTDTDERPLNRGSAEASSYKRPGYHADAFFPSQPRSTQLGDTYGNSRWQDGFSTEQLVWDYGHCGGHAMDSRGFRIDDHGVQRDRCDCSLIPVPCSNAPSVIMDTNQCCELPRSLDLLKGS